MADQTFWRKLAHDFGALPADGVCLDWQYTTGSLGRCRHTLNGQTPALLSRFRLLAWQAGAVLDCTDDRDPVERWLDELRQHVRTPENRGTICGEEVLDDGTRVCHVVGRISNLHEASANRCMELEFEALQESRTCDAHRRAASEDFPADGQERSHIETDNNGTSERAQQPVVAVSTRHDATAVLRAAAEAGERESAPDSSVEALIDEHEYARIRNCSVATVRRDRHLRKGCRYVKTGTSVRYRLQDVREFIERNLQGTGKSGV